MNKHTEKCRGAHCRCMNLNNQCPNFHYGDHDCPFDSKKAEEIPIEKEWNKIEQPQMEKWEKELESMNVAFGIREENLKSFVKTLLFQARAEVAKEIEKYIDTCEIIMPKHPITLIIKDFVQKFIPKEKTQ